MFATIAHEIPGRIRFATGRPFSDQEANALRYALVSGDVPIYDVNVYQKTGSVMVAFPDTVRNEVVRQVTSIKRGALSKMNVPVSQSIILDPNHYPERIASMVLGRVARRIFLPLPLRMAYGLYKATPIVWRGFKTLLSRKLDVSVLDATAILFAILTKDFASAAEIGFLLGLGEVFEEWTERKSNADLASSLMGQEIKAWVMRNGEEMLVNTDEIGEGEEVIVRMGYTIPLDGTVICGEGQVNQASLTGESVAVTRQTGDSVFAGTVLEEGELHIAASATSNETRLARIMHMIDDANDQKSSVESRVARLADRIVPYNLAFGLLVGLFTRNIYRMSSAFVVDYSCALKLATSISVLSAMREGAARGFTIKGGKQLEQLAQADTIVFDKTGTLTHACPRVTNVIPFNGHDANESLRLAACLEEHFPHPMARAIVKAAVDKDLKHRERHAEVEYIVAHGIVSSLEGKRILIGSPHFIFEDEGVTLCDKAKRVLETEANRSSVLFLAEEKHVIAAIVLEDPIRDDAPALIASLRRAGFSKVVMLTGDAEAAAREAAICAGVDEYQAQMLPEGKAAYIAKLKEAGHKVVMVGDGINDSLALATADIGIAMCGGADVAREVADITLNTNDLSSVVMLRLMSKKLFKRLNSTYGFIIAVNTLLLGLGVTGRLTSGTSALLHNGSTIGVGLSSMRNLYPKTMEIAHALPPASVVSDDVHPIATKNLA